MHIAKLAEKVSASRSTPTEPTDGEDELGEAVEFINDHFVFLESKDGGLSTIDSIIDRAKQAVMRKRVRSDHRPVQLH